MIHSNVLLNLYRNYKLDYYSAQYNFYLCSCSKTKL